MKKKILSIFLLSVLLGSQVSMSVFATTNISPITTQKDGVEIKTYSNDSLLRIESRNANGTIKFEHNGTNYSFNMYTDRVGYNQKNKFAAVLYAQTKFNYKLGLSLAEDGIFGQATHSATETYQRTRGLSVDCIIGPTTWDYLFRNI